MALEVGDDALGVIVLVAERSLAFSMLPCVFGLVKRPPPAPRHLKIGSVGCAAHLDMSEHSLEFALRRERPRDGFEHTQVGVLEGVGAGDRGLTAIIRSPRPDLTGGA